MVLSKVISILLIINSLIACSTFIQQSPLDNVYKALGVEQNTFIYLVRHAEKQSIQGKDPSLTAKGEQRAKNLASVLKSVNLSAVYSTPYKRTIETGTPTAKSKNLVIVQGYKPAEEFAHELLSNHQGESILVVGHSNTTPELIKALGVETTITIEHHQYGDLFIVEIDNSRIKLTVSSF